MKRDVKSIVARLSIGEKASLCSGKDFWFTKPIPHEGIESSMLTDGPHGLRKQSSSSERDGLQASVPATCFPSGAGMAASWNAELIEEIGRAIGREASYEDVGVVLGPALNIKRSPLCGRNFEYYSEDPLLAGKLAAALVRGIQSAGVGACPKHFAVNNQERLRMSIDARVDERSLREIYLSGFEIAVKEGKPWTIMCAYNKVNGAFCAQNRFLLTDVLRGEWGFDGTVMTDWGANDDRVEGLMAGQDLEMPGNGGMTDADIVRAVESGALPAAVLDLSVERLLSLALRIQDGKASKPADPGLGEHHALARRAVAECSVLLKNEGGILPLPQNGRIAFLGAFAKTPRFQGGGSSHIEPSRLDSAFDEARKIVGPSGRIDFAAGYSINGGESDYALIAEAAAIAKEADAAVVFIGLPPDLESEGFDRQNLSLPEKHLALLEAALSAQKKVVVVLSNGSALEMPWIGRAGAVIEGYLGGQAWGGGIADILFGKANPSGKLPETFPIRLADVPCRNYFPGGSSFVEYREGVFVGYRHYDSAGAEPLFPFGHGLSYTRFEYGAVRADRKSIVEGEPFVFSVDIKNSGKTDGAETVQVYVRDIESSIPRPFQELKAFKKLFIAAGSQARAEFSLDERAFSFWDDASHGWKIESGDFEIRVGSSSRDIRSAFIASVRAKAKDKRSFGMNTRYFELKDSFAGRAFMAEIEPFLRMALSAYVPGSPEALMTEANQRETPLRNIARMSGGALPLSRIERLIADMRAEDVAS